MSFVDVDDVIEIQEGFLKRVFGEVLGVELQTPFKRMPYAEAMSRFGSDKPDLRFGYEIKDISDIAKSCEFKVFSAPPARRSGAPIKKKFGARLSRKKIDAPSGIRQDIQA
jgi:aspartyl-tRNA synthetase